MTGIESAPKTNEATARVELVLLSDTFLMNDDLVEKLVGERSKQDYRKTIKKMRFILDRVEKNRGKNNKIGERKEILSLFSPEEMESFTATNFLLSIDNYKTILDKAEATHNKYLKIEMHLAYKTWKGASKTQRGLLANLKEIKSAIEGKSTKEAILHISSYDLSVRNLARFTDKGLISKNRAESLAKNALRNPDGLAKVLAQVKQKEQDRESAAVERMLISGLGGV